MFGSLSRPVRTSTSTPTSASGAATSSPLTTRNGVAAQDKRPKLRGAPKSKIRERYTTRRGTPSPKSSKSPIEPLKAAPEPVL